MTEINDRENSHQIPPYDRLHDAVTSAKLPPPALQMALKALDFLSQSSSESPEYRKTASYIDYLIKLPWSRTTGDFSDMTKIENSLNDLPDIAPDARTAIVKHLSLQSPKITPCPRILVVDDEEVALKNIARLLRKEGYEVVTSPSGEDAIVELESSRFDIVLTDLRMANIDGIYVLEKTKKMYPETDVIVITGYATTETAVEAMRKGAFHYLVKPLQINELRAIVSEALDSKRSGSAGRTILCLSGSSSEKKAMIGKALSTALGREFREISFNDIKKETDITGENRLSGGQFPGRIIENICQSGTSNPVIMINDLDKVDGSFGTLMRDVFNSDKNRHFVDNFIELPYDLSNVIFIATANNTGDISSSLKNSLKIVDC